MKNINVLISTIRLTRRDPMLLLLLLAPWLAGSALRIGLPLLQPVLMDAFSFDLIPWYPLADMLMLMLAPLLAGMLCGFLMLDERDEGVAVYYSVTPLGGGGYLTTRLLLPVLWSVVIAPLLSALLSLTHPDMLHIVLVALCGGLFGASLALLLLAFAGNKVEGLAISKIMGLLMLPMIIPFITDSPLGYLAGAFPAFWMGALFKGPLYMLPAALIVCFSWLALLYRRTLRKQV
jgi:fluoroquinolone transport system permease protein